MAKAGHRPGLKPAEGGRRPSRAVWLARAGAIASLVVVAALGVRSLRLAGFQFRWEETAVRAPPGERLERRVETVPARADASSGDPDPVAAAASSGEPGRLVATSLEAPHPPDAELPVPGRGTSAAIDFETFADGTATCAPCEVSDEWRDRGLRLSFRSWSAASTAPHVLDGRDYLPARSSGVHALGPALSADRGLEVGVIRLDFPERPRRVSFTLYGPDIVPRFEVVAWSGVRILDGAIRREGRGTHAVAGRGAFREVRVTVESAAGIDRISLDGWGPPGHMLLVDDLAIEP